MYVGRLSKEKGILELIASLRTIEIPFQLFIKGDGLIRKNCEDISDDRFKFLGFKNDPWLDSSDYDLVIIPSFYEGFCLVGIEAIAHGIPVIVNDLPIFREILDFLPEECFFNINSKHTLESSLCFCLNNRNQLSKLIEDHKFDLLHKFSVESMQNQYKNIYNMHML